MNRWAAVATDVATARGGSATSYWIESKPLAAAERSGDFAACFDIVDRRAIIVGDIPSHHSAVGDASALAVVVQSLLARGVPLTKILRVASNVFSQAFTTEVTPSASLFLAVADLHARTFEYASAGHVPALLFSGKGATTHHHLPPTGPLLGVEPRPHFRSYSAPLAAESLLAVVTDGITEARREGGDEFAFFGIAGVHRALRDALRDERDPAHAICCAAAAYAGGALSDDASVVVSAFPPDRRRTGR